MHCRGDTRASAITPPDHRSHTPVIPCAESGSDSVRRDWTRRAWIPDAVAVAAIIAVYLVLVVPTLTSFGILWDEQTDLDITRSYIGGSAGWLTGSINEPTQTRLPMFTVARVFELLGRMDLSFARLISCVVSILTLLALFVYARISFGRAAAILASALLATSPFFLAFSRIALTEGDAFVTAAVAWTVVALARAVDSPTVGRTMLCGVTLGLAVSAKFVAIALVPVFLVAPWLVDSTRVAPRGDQRASAFVVVISSCALAAAIGGLGWFYWYRPQISEQAMLAATVFSIPAIVYASMLLLLARSRHQIVGGVVQPLVALSIAAATFFLIPPVHLTRAEHASSLLHEMIHSSGIEPTEMLQWAGVHTLTLLFKPGVAVGVIVWTCVVLAACRWRSDTRVRIPLLCVAVYLAFLLKMRLAQTFYTMPIFPWMLLLAADRLTALWHRHHKLAVAIVAVCFATVANDIRFTYPHYQLNGYQWLGARYVLGRSTLAYRGVAQVNSDGVEQALTWLNEHARAGERVKTYIGPDHIVRAISAHPGFTLIDGLRPPSPSLNDVEYVVTTLHADIRPSSPAGLFGGGSIFQYPYDRNAIVRDFDPVFRVQRPFGLEFATVWRRRH